MQPTIDSRYHCTSGRTGFEQFKRQSYFLRPIPLYNSQERRFIITIIGCYIILLAERDDILFYEKKRKMISIYYIKLLYAIQ